MPLYKMRNVLQAGGIKAFWRLEAGVTRGPVPEGDESQERIRRLQQDLQESRQTVKAKNRQISRLRKQRQPRQVGSKNAEQNPKQGQKKGPRQNAVRKPRQSAGGKVDPAEFGATLPIPPRDMGPITQAREVRSYLRMGENIKERLLYYAGVTPTSSILDIGAGPGRVARHFVDYVEPPGRYVGMDIEKPNMDWCEENLSAANPAFNFFHQNVYNGMYNPGGKYSASEYRFPFEDASFDVIFLTSIFTHLVPEDTQNYLREISRLLKPDGACFCTWFLLGHELDVKYMGAHSKEARVGYGFRSCLEMFEKAGLTFAQEPRLGNWRGQDSAQSEYSGNQDLLLLSRSPAENGLLSRYEAPGLPPDRPSELEEATGTIRMFDPVSSTLTLQVGEEEVGFGVPAETELRMHGQIVDSAVLRPGQEATVHFARGGERGVVKTIHATDRPRKLNDRMPRISGTLEVLDRERGLVTLIVANSVRSFKFDPGSVAVRSGGESMALDDLRLGQGIAVEQVDGKGTITSLG